jgi:chemotaxis methyl-accepting protein methylase
VKRDLVAAAGMLLKIRAGLDSQPMVRARLSRCLDEGAVARGLSAEAYLALIDLDPVAFQELLDRVTVQHSYFFRDPNQFLALKGLLLAAPSPFLIWSAACGNGQEAYSIAMLLEEAGRSDWRILATDVSSAALARVRAGRYAEAEVSGVSDQRLKRHFSPSAQGWEVLPRLRERVDTRRHNLSDAAPPLPNSSFWLIFCRNVLIYFDRPSMDACVGRLAACLPDGGHLFLGFSESLPAGSSGLNLVRIGDAFVYRKGAIAGADPKVPARQGRPVDQQHLLAEGEAAFAAGNPAGAVRAFRKATYLNPDQPVGFFQLGTALEHAGDHREARRAFAAAGAALARADPAAIHEGLEGYTSAELGKAIAAKLGTS